MVERGNQSGSGGGCRKPWVPTATTRAEASRFCGRTGRVVSLPTGYGKTLCIAALPGTYDHLLGNEGQSVVVVVSPLIALMEEQVAFFKERGLSVAYVSLGGDEKSVEDGRCQFVFVCPEMLLCNRKCQKMLRSELYCANLVGLVIDEAHCVMKLLADWLLYLFHGLCVKMAIAKTV